MAGEIICLDCFGDNKLYLVTSGCFNGGKKIPRAGHRLIMMTATWSVKKYGVGEDDPKYILGSHTSSKESAIW